MKKSNLVMIVLSIIALLLFTSPITAEGSWDSQITTSVDSLSIGYETTVNTTLSSSVIDPYQGTVDYYALNSTDTLGKPGTAIVSSSDPTIQFSPTRDINTMIIQMPIESVTNIGNTGNIEVALMNDGSTIFSSLIYYSVFQTMVNDGIIKIVLGSAQNPKITQPVQLFSSKTYKLQLRDAHDEVIFNFGASISEETELIDGTLATGNSVPLIIHEGTHLGEVSVTGTTHSFSFTPIFVYDQMLSYYSDLSGSYTASYHLQDLTYTNNTEYELTSSDETMTQDTSTTISALFRENGIARNGINIKFKLDHGSFFELLGEDITDGSGIAEISYFADIEPGSYQVKIMATTTSGTISTTIELTLTKPVVEFTNVQATGSYGSSVNESTKISVSGQILRSGAGVNDANVSLIRTTAIINSSITGSDGRFMYTWVENIPIDTYVDEFTLIAEHSEYSINNKSIDLTITKGNPTINVIEDTFNPNFGDIVMITGNLTDQSGDLLNGEITLEIKNGSYQEITSTDTSGMFSIDLSIDYVGQYNYRLKYVETSNYSKTSTIIEIISGKTTAQLSIEQDLYLVELHETISISVLLQSEVDQEATIIVSTMDMALSEQVEVARGSTIVKQFSFNFTASIYAIDISGNYISYYDLPIYVNLVSDVYNHTETSTMYQLRPTELHYNLNTTEYMVNDEVALQIDTTDKFGIDGLDGEQIFVEYGSTYLTETIVDGDVTITHIFGSGGTIYLNIGVITSNTYPIPYYNHNQTIQINIVKGELFMSIDSITANQGEFVRYDSKLFDHRSQTVDRTVNVEVRDGIWKSLGQNTTSNGHFIFEFSINQNFSLGEHEIRFSIPSDDYYYQFTNTTTMTIEKILTDITIDAPAEISYNSPSSERLVEVELQTVFGTLLTGETITLEINNQLLQQTTNNNGVAEFELPNLISPGEYIIKISFNGSTEYMKSNDSHNLTVVGTSTYFEWITAPKDTYYGAKMVVELGIHDQNNEYLEGMSVKIYVDDALVASGITNSSGYLKFNVQLLFDAEELTIDIIAEPMDGFEGTSNTFVITQHHRELATHVALQDGTNTTVFGENLDIYVYTYSDVDPELGDVTVRIYLYNQTSGVKQYIGVYYSNNTGDIVTSLELKNLSTADDYSLFLELSKKYYKDHTIIVTYDIVPAEFELSSSYTPTSYLNETNITFELSGVSINGKQIIVTIIDEYHNYEQIEYTDVTGSVHFTFLPRSSGQITVGYEIVDPEGNYLKLVSNLVLDVDKNTPIINIDQVDISGTPYLNLTLSIDNYLVDGTVSITLGESNTGTYLVNGYLLIDVSSHTEVEIYSQETTNLYSTSSTYSVKMITSELTVSSTHIYANLPSNITITLDADNLDNHLIKIYLIEGDNETLIGQGYTSDSTVTILINQIFSTGEYELKIIYPEQSIYTDANLVTTIQVEKQPLYVTVDYDQFIAGHNTNFTISIKSPTGTIPEQLSYELHLGSDIISSGTLTSLTDLSLLIDMQLGQYMLQLHIDETEVSANYIYGEEIVVLQETAIKLIVQDDARYGDNNLVVLQLVDASTSRTIENESISIYLCNVFCNDNQKLVTRITTNSTGHAVFQLPIDYLPDLYDFYAIYSYSGNTYANSDLTFTVQISPEQVDVVVDVRDFGVTHNITIIITVVDEQGIINITGDLVLVIDGENTSYIYTGPIELVLTGNQAIGDFGIYATFTPDSEYYISDSSSYTYGWNKIDTITVSGSQRLGYLDYYPYQFYTGETSIHGLNIAIYIDGKLYATTQLRNGTIDLRVELVPGSYEIKFKINDKTYLSTQFSYSTIVEISDGDQHFTVNATGTNYGDKLQFTIDDIAKNASYLIEIENGLETIRYTTTELAFELSELLLPGNYSVRITRTHQFLHDRTVTLNVEINPIDAIVIPDQDGDKIVLTLNPAKELDGMYILVNIRNDTHNFEYNITDLFIPIEFSPGQYEFSYTLYGSYTGSGKVAITISASSDSDDQTGIVGPQFSAINPELVGILGVLGIIGVKHVLKRKSGDTV